MEKPSLHKRTVQKIELLQISLYGKTKIEEDIKQLQNLKKEAKQRCITNESDKAHMNKKSPYSPWSPEVIGYEVE